MHVLQIRNIVKQYKTGDLTQDALNDVSLTFRDSEFVAVLGPSGSGKTTMLNIVGGLDRYDSGDLIINGVSTRKYKDRDWDSYRNHSVGFVFQSYNLIPHQSILSNVDMALTISGVAPHERRERALRALEQVGLADQKHKKPNQMSGGQMQRVAIARALVNNPDILLADEPTGALDSEISIQVLDLLKEVAKDRLVVMVTHNADLAEKYATRIIRLKDGRVISDSDPFEQPDAIQEPEHRNLGKASMSYLTSLSLSFSNLLTKKGRTLLTAFAGSIGIIGIALILSLSNGVNTYIEDIQQETMTAYPITIDAETVDLGSMMNMGDTRRASRERNHASDAVYANNAVLEMAGNLTASLTKNNLTAFKQYLEDPANGIGEYLGEHGIVYSYDVPFGVYAYNTEGELADAKSNTFVEENLMPTYGGAMGNIQETMMGSMTTGGRGPMLNIFEELLPGAGDTLVSSAVRDSYTLLRGTWPEEDSEVLIVLDERNELPTTALYALGVIPEDEYRAQIEAIEKGEAFEAKTFRIDYDEIMERRFYVLPAGSLYTKNEEGRFDYIGDSMTQVESMLGDAIELTVAGIIRPDEDAATATVSGAVGYTNALTKRIIDSGIESSVVKAQLDSPDIDVMSGLQFAPNDDAAKVQDAKQYLEDMGISEKASFLKEMAGTMTAGSPEQLERLEAFGEAELAAMADQFFATAPDDVFLRLYDSAISLGSYAENMASFGYVNTDEPSSISIYAGTFEAKEAIAASIQAYNETAGEDGQIVYTDFVAMLTSSITTIISVISYVLVAFVAVSLIVSSIMIGIITYISVLERTKEIGILRAVGASKRNISQVFSAETFIIGLLSGGLGVGLARLLLIPGNIVIHALADSPDINAVLPLPSALILIVLSVILTVIAGLIPSRKAAAQDPVAALRNE